MIELNKEYSRDTFLNFLKNDFIPDFSQDLRDASKSPNSGITEACYMGESKNLDLQIFEFIYEGSSNKRVTLTKEAFAIMRDKASFRALAVFKSKDSSDWRLSLLTASPTRGENGRVILSYSNPRRLSFLLGPNAKINTPTKFLLKKEMLHDFEDLKNRFSIEIVNKEFYNEISTHFNELVGGTIYKGKKKIEKEALLKIPSVQDSVQTSLEFAVRLIGRIIFCWFLREKKSSQGKSLMPHNLLSLQAIKDNSDYYHKIL